MANRLAESTSPYLLQHADNPVDWYPWGEEAFAKARQQDKPILLSVGYSACHWCHVMAHESFEDETTAAQMNAGFVNVKVDREERPDVDRIYMQAVQAISGHGGWPMTVFLAPDGRPFFAGTYFPKSETGGHRSFRSVLTAVEDAWRDRRDDLLDQAGRLTEAVSQRLPAAEAAPGVEQLEAAYQALAASFDQSYGGFGGAPKFPQQPVLEFLLRASGESWAPAAAGMVHQTLTTMARSGLNDQIGGGFARYCVDREWIIPHFEKMLYDNATLARLYLWAGVRFDDQGLVAVAKDVLGYLLRDLRNELGGFSSAEDADSEGEEGRFYVWSSGEFDLVAADGAALARDFFGVTEAGNFEGANHLVQATTLPALAKSHGVSEMEAAAVVAAVRSRLLETRSERVRPGLDDKAVASWNGLALLALAEAAAALDDSDLQEHAVACARFIDEHLTVSPGRLYRSWAKGRATVPGFLEDHAAVALGYFRTYQLTGDSYWFQQAGALVETIATDFSNPEGGFFATAAGVDRNLITRPDDLMDNPHPGGNSMAVEALTLYASYTGEARWRQLADDAINAAGLLVDRYPSAVGQLLAALVSRAVGSRELAVVGPDASILTSVYWEKYRPHFALAWATGQGEPVTVPLLENRGKLGSTLAYVCEDFVCAAPTESVELLREQLG